MITGSCLCHKVTYQAKELQGSIIFCHCSFCRKVSATAFSTNANVKIEDFTILTGQDNLATYESSPGKLRYFCSNCHSQIYHFKENEPDKIMLKLGTIDECHQDLSQMERRHIHNDQSFPWLQD